jgi:hypothetical protein
LAQSPQVNILADQLSNRHYPVALTKRGQALNRIWTLAAVAAATITSFTTATSTYAAAGDDNTGEIDRGRYMIVTGHCNNCHTPGYAASLGKLPEKEWLTGTALGNRGPWGTTYASNLRLSIQNFTEEQWITYAKVMRPRPPMPWWSVHETTAQDLRAMYKFIKQLGPAGEPSRPSLPPDVEPPQPYVIWPSGAR